MKTAIRRPPALRALALGLTLGLLALSGAVYAQTVPHALHHAHHQAATHATVLCAWMCAAGQALSGSLVVFNATIAPFGFTELLPSDRLQRLICLTALSRGPPGLFV